MKRKRATLPLGLKPAEAGEAASLAFSLVLLSTLVAYLVYMSFQPQDKHVSVSATAQAVVETEAGSGQYVLPVAVVNRSPRGISFLQLDLDIAGRARTLEVEDIAGRSTRKIYVYVDRNYGRDSISVAPLYYRLD